MLKILRNNEFFICFLNPLAHNPTTNPSNPLINNVYTIVEGCTNTSAKNDPNPPTNRPVTGPKYIPKKNIKTSPKFIKDEDIVILKNEVAIITKAIPKAFITNCFVKFLFSII